MTPSEKTRMLKDFDITVRNRRAQRYIDKVRRLHEVRNRRIVLVAAIALALLSLVRVGLTVPAKADEPEPVSVTITAAPVIPTPTTEPEPFYPLEPAERDLIAAVVWGEARGEGQDGMEAVAEVVLNRLQDGRFGATVTEVAVKDQFHGLGQEDPQEAAFEAVDAVFRDGQTGLTNGALYFCTGNPDAIKAGLVEVARVGRHIFYTDKEELTT